MKLVVGLGLVALIAATEMISMNQILKDFTPGFGGNGAVAVWKRLGVA